MASRVRALVPACIALSVRVTGHDLAFTLMPDHHGPGYLDAMQYLSDTPRHRQHAFARSACRAHHWWGQPLRLDLAAFDGHHEELAEICGAWAGGAVTNADLSFTSCGLLRRRSG